MPDHNETEQQEEFSSASPSSSTATTSSKKQQQQKKTTSKRRQLKKSSSTPQTESQDDIEDNNELTPNGTTTSDTTTTTTSLNNNNRQWIKDETVQNQQTAAYSILVGITTRDESEPVYDTPCKMYSSLRYKLQYKCTVNVDGNELKENPKLLMCRVTVIDEDSAKEIKKDGKAIIDDSLISLKQTSSGGALSFEATHKIKFKDVSFHYNKSKWRLLLQLFSDAHGSISTPVVVLKSAPFLVYARRPKVSERGASDGLLTSGMNSSSQQASSSSGSTTSSSTTASNSDANNETTESSGAHVVANALLNQASGDKKKKKKGAAHMDLKKRKRSTSMAGNTVIPLKIEKKHEPSKLLTASNGEEMTSLSPQPSSAEHNATSTVKNAQPTSASPTKTLKQKKKLMEKFSHTLDALLKLHDEMDANDKTIAFELLQQKLYSHFYSNLVEQQQHWLQMTQMPSPENGDMDHSSHHAHHEENGGIHIDDQHQIVDSSATILQAGSAEDIEHDSFSCSHHQNQSHAFTTHGEPQQHESCHDSGLFLTLCEIGSHHSHNNHMSTSLSFESESILASSDFHPLFN